eukprot:CAMPEP_0197178378 /NCGR_PEP_ID=MMETSP1423-20130617/3674_1 /TAXON_ID=476441 /ORGANISM="Pseudo-nitzschia heimii, Strain UNC1101" /LENGTH=1318 /DNA_ID=CAMNT_0042628103 /DNA_START=274 /DNA_END=4230 /DNA_ORIENTATION=+
MEISVVDENGVKDEPVRDQSENPSSSLDSCEKSRNRSDHDKTVNSSVEIDHDPVKKKNTSGTGRKTRKGSNKKPSTKTSSRRKQSTDDNGSSGHALGRSVHSALNRTIKPTTRIKTRRQSIGSINKCSATFDVKNGKDDFPAIKKSDSVAEDRTRATDNDSYSNLSETSSDIDSVLSQTQTISTREKPSSNRSLDTMQSQKNRSQTSSTLSLRSLSTHNNRNRPSSSRSLLSNAESLNLSSHSYSNRNHDHVDSRNASFETNDSSSDLEVDAKVKHSGEDVPSVIENVKNDVEISVEASPPNDKNSSRSKGSSRSLQPLREGRSDNRVSDSKQRKSRHSQQAQTDELGRGSNHYKLEGVHFNQMPESKSQVVVSNDSDVDEEEIQVLTKISPSDSNDQEKRKRTSNKPRFRSRRRSSMGSGADQLARTRSRSREQLSTRNFSRIRSSSSEKHAKRGPGGNISSPKPSEGVKKRFGSDALASKEDTITEKNVDLKAPVEKDDTGSENGSSPISSSKVVEETSHTENENTTLDDRKSFNQSISDTTENSTNIENEDKKMNMPSQDTERKQRRRSSMGRSMRKDRFSGQSRQGEKKVSTSDTTALEGSRFVSETKIMNTISDCQPSSDAKAIVIKTAENENKNTNSQTGEVERKQRRRSSMGRTMRKDRISRPLQGTEKEILDSNIAKSHGDPNIAANKNDQASKTEKKTSDDMCSPDAVIKDVTEEESSAKIDVQAKALERKQRRRSSMGRTMRKDRVSTPSQVGENELHGSNISQLQQDPNIAAKNRDQNSKTETESTAADEICLSTTSIKDTSTEESLANMEHDSMKVEVVPKDLERKQRRRSSMGKTMRKDRISTPQEGERKPSKSNFPQLNEDQITVAKTIDRKPLYEPENGTSDSRHSCDISNKDTNAEESKANLENGTTKHKSTSNEIEKKQRRRSSSGKPTRKDKSSHRIASKSGHKLSRKSTRERKSRDTSKKQDSTEGDNSEDLASEDFASEEFSSEEEASEKIVAGNDEANQCLNIDSMELAKNQSSTRKEKTSTRKKTESSAEGGEFRDRLKGSVAAPSLSNLFSSSDHNAKEANDINGSLAPSLCSNESEEKDDEESDEDNYLQLTFVAENGIGADNLFALMDEQLNGSFNQSDSNDMDASNAESGDRNASNRTFVSFTNEIELKVSTTSYSLSRNVYDGDDPANETFHCNHAMFIDGSGEEISTKMKKASTPTPRRKKLSSPSFGLSRSLHAADPFGDSGFVNGSLEESTKTPKRGMLRKMRKGITEGSKLTFQRAASTRNMLGQATTKVLARRKEEGRGLLCNDSD